MSCRAYAKALHYKEEEFHRGPTSRNLEALISINNKLQQPDAAAGVLVFAKQQIKGDFVSLCVSPAVVYVFTLVCLLLLLFVVVVSRRCRSSGTRVSTTGRRPTRPTLRDRNCVRTTSLSLSGR